MQSWPRSTLQVKKSSLIECYCYSTNFSKLLNFVNNKISQNTQFAIPPVKMNELLQDLLNLDINKSTGTDNIGPKILKVSGPFIVSPLTYIFNRIIDSGIYPNILNF